MSRYIDKDNGPDEKVIPFDQIARLDQVLAGAGFAIEFGEEPNTLVVNRNGLRLSTLRPEIEYIIENQLSGRSDVLDGVLKMIGVDEDVRFAICERVRIAVQELVQKAIH